MQTTQYMTSVLDRRQVMSLLQYEGENHPQDTVALLDKGAAIILPNNVGQIMKVCDKYLVTNSNEYDIKRRRWI